MSTAPHPRGYDDVLAEAIRILTEAARLTTTHGTGPDATRDRIDWAAFLVRAAAAAAANIGGVEEILAGCPDTGEAGRVRHLLHAAVGAHGEYLPSHRTDPLRFTIYVETLLDELEQAVLYAEADQELAAQIEVAGQSGDNHTVHELQARREQLHAQRTTEWVAYGSALAAALRKAAAERYPTTHVEIDIELAAGTGPDLDRKHGPHWHIWGRAIDRTPLPSGLRPRDYPFDLTDPDRETKGYHIPAVEPTTQIAANDRAAGRTPLNRLTRHADRT